MLAGFCFKAILFCLSKSFAKVSFLSSFSLPPYNFIFINFITYSLFLYSIILFKEKKLKIFNFFFLGFTFGYGYFASSLYWVSHSLTFDRQLTFLIPIAILGLPILLAVFYGLAVLVIYSFVKRNYIFLDKGFKLILIRSRRTPENIIDFAKKFFLNSAVIIDFVSKEFYLSALKISKTIIVTCDSTSMISECAITQKPIFVAKMKAKRRNKRFEYFLNSFKEIT